MAGKKASVQTNLRPVIVTTKHRGVFFGYAEDIDGDPITLMNARMCVYWHESVHGVLGLAAAGPNNKCRVGSAIPSIQLRDVTAVMGCSPEAVTAWEKGPWA